MIMAKKSKSKKIDIKDEIAKSIIDNSNQENKIIMVGVRGQGMSYVALALAEAAAKKIAVENGDKESNWKNYFIDKTIIDPNLIEQTKSKNKSCVCGKPPYEVLKVYADKRSRAIKNDLLRGSGGKAN